MWKILGPLVLLVVVLLFQLQLQESFVTTVSDASGNITDASGSPVTKPGASTISLTLADLLSLFKATAGTPSAQATGTTGGTTSTVFYSSTTTTPGPVSSDNLSSSASSSTSSSTSAVDGVANAMLTGSPYTPAQPLPSDSAPCSDSAAQGVEFQNALQDYIKKDEIPCYGCTL